MATRTRTTWMLRSDGQYDGRVGWKLGGSGQRQQHRFRLGGDLREAQRRDHLLRKMWERIEASQPQDAIWKEDTLDLARLVAKGVTHHYVPRRPAEGVVPYAQRVARLRQLFPMLAVLPEPEYGSAFGVKILETLQAAHAEAELRVDKDLEAGVRDFQRRMASCFDQHHTSTPKAAEGGTLHVALRAYRD